ncbi:peptidoglycan/xylan/chitin deacetylase (PgdA/CDA1 family) [Brevundimonas nasdae]|uniref:polysaccharide deacetylase family protein n=1 Tax=Brevundimonas nasdae TaxID=172043 RepID=UPI0019131408|nr:polysaccharide deacetylase family protein [Brevundimonas nasdae]MBK6024422.1 polysaccharide deacetylase family protein [Brevundimonas nasdae]MDQ0451080.1 peptidoglycan/xylan/chitin deacetylase (PgdA/CDA1 family) [Brevundimonas nasdae]
MNAFIDKMRRRAGRYLDVRPMTVRPARGVLSLSFDDIPASAWTEAGPILAEHGVLATYYVCGGLAGGRNMALPQFEVEHLQDLYEAGHEVGCHTYEHVSTLTLSPVELDASLARNAAWVAERLDGYEMQTFAYPFGDCALKAKPVIDNRFLCGRGVRDGVNAGTADRNLLQAIGLESRRLPGYDLEKLIEETAASKGWLIAYGHDVSDAPTPYGCRPENLDRLIRLAKAANLDIQPVAAAWRLATAG